MFHIKYMHTCVSFDQTIAIYLHVHVDLNCKHESTKSSSVLPYMSFVTH